MRTVKQLVHTRTRVRTRYALLPLEGFPVSRLPTWPDAQVKVLASPRLGAEFVQYLIELPAGRGGTFEADDTIETFYFVLNGAGKVGQNATGGAGSFGLLPPGSSFSFHATDAARLLVLRKRYEPAPSIAMFKPLHGHESDVKKEIWADNLHSLLQALVPDELQYDMAMNIFTF